MNNDAQLKRVVVVGASGSGKTTLAQQLALRLDVPHVELDALFWEANWTSVSPEIFRERVTQALAGDRWVTDGNFRQVSDLTWGRADTVLPRTFRRIFTRQALWNGNRESLLQGLFSRESIIIWALKTSKEKRQRYLAAQVDPAYDHLDIIRLGTPSETHVLLSRLSVSSYGEAL